MAHQSTWAWPGARPQAAARPWTNWPLMAGAVAVAGPCMWLAAAHGGASTADQTFAYTAVFVLLAAWAAIQCRRGIAVRLPLLCWFALLWPLVGLAPLPRMLLEHVDVERAAELATFARAGIPSPPTISLYPYATARAFLVVAGSVAVFTLARAFASRSTAALQWMAGAILVMALAEALPALRQLGMLATGAARPLEPGSDFIRGTFSNRNLLGAWLEGCYGLSLALFVGGRRYPGGERSSGLWALAGVAALASAVAVICSMSRMAAVALVAETGLVAALVRSGRGGRLATVALVLGTVVCALGAGTRLTERFSAEALRIEKEGRFAMWADSAQAIRRYPVLGSGAGTFPFAFRRSHPYLTGYAIDHAHCEYLETTVEWGIPAAVLLVAGAVAGLWGLARRAARAGGIRRSVGAGCLAGICGVLLHGLADFPLRIPAVLALVAVLAGVAAASLPARHAAAPAGPWRGAALATGALALLLALGLPQVWNAETHCQQARQYFAEGRFAAAAAFERRALEDCPYAAAAWSDLAAAEEAQGSRTAALAASDRALALEPHSSRIEWPAANLRVRLGETARALPLFGALAADTPELRRPARQACREAGVLDAYVRYLVSQGLWEVATEAAGSRVTSP